MTDYNSDPDYAMKIEFDERPEDESDPAKDLDEDTEKRLLEYLLKRLDSDMVNRTNRVKRFARIDQHISTWQILSPEDSKRDQREELTGRSQAIPVNLPLTKGHIDDAVAFYAEVYAPIGGNFYANPGKKDKSKAVLDLTKKMEQDSKINQFYTHVCSTMRALNKYNIGGFHVYWTESSVNADSAARDSTGNACESIDVYNFLYDPSISDVTRLYYEGEWSAIAKVKNRLWLMRMHQEGELRHYDEILSCNAPNGSNSYEYGKAKYFKHPPKATSLNSQGNDTKTSEGDQTYEVDWDSFNMSVDSDSQTDIAGYEVIRMYCWINPKQFDLAEEDTIQLWEFLICNGTWIIRMKAVPDALYLPTYMSRLNIDDMLEAERSIAELVRPFQRLTSFLFNTHVEAIRSAIWGLKVYDPDGLDATTIQNGETSGLLASKKPGRDVRSLLMKVDTGAESTKQNLQDAGTVMDLMKQLFPNQGLPSQIAGMDRAVNSQVQAVLQGALRKLHMFVRNLDATLMLPVRQAQYRNIALFDPEKSGFKDITPEEVAELLASGLGQISREAAAEQVRTVLFALIQNPEGAAGFDIGGLFTLWSGLLNIGTDLGEFVKAPLPDPNAIPPGAAGPEGMPVDPNAAIPAQMPAGIQ